MTTESKTHEVSILSLQVNNAVYRLTGDKGKSKINNVKISFVSR